MSKTTSLVLWYFKFWNTLLESEYLGRSFWEKFLIRSFSRFTESERAARTLPWLSSSLIQKMSSIFLDCFPLRRLVPFIVNLGFFFDRMVEYSIALENSANHNGEVLLDIGSGYSFFPSYLSSRAHTISLDIGRDAMVFQKKASKLMRKNVSQKLECVVADCTRLPFKDESFHKVFVISTIEHIEKDNIVAKESGRVLKKNGMCVVSFPSFSREVREPQIRPYFQRFYTKEAMQERIIIPSLLSIEELFNLRKTLVSFFYSVVPDGWFILKDLAVGLTLLKLEEILLSENKEGTLEIIRLRKDFKR